MSSLTQLTLVETLNLVDTGEVSVDEVVKAYLERVSQFNQTLGAYLIVSSHCNGIPAAIKDVIVTKDIVTTASSKILETFTPPYNATVVERLLNQGIGVMGKTNCDEFAMGSSNENSAYGPVRNPWDLEKVSGGSSGGSAAAVAADLCIFALGSDTGGSIRQPASLCGVVGLKPSYGRVSRYGLISMASSLDQIGPMTKSVADARLIMEWISGPDGRDSNAINSKFKIENSKLKFKMQNLRVGVPREYFGKGLDAEIEKVIKGAIRKLEELGAKIVEVSLPHTEYAVATYYIIMPSEVSANLARFDGIRFGGSRELFGPETKRRIMLGTFALSTGYIDEYFNKAAKVRTLIKQDFEKAFQKCDVIVGPVSPTPAWNIGEKINDPLKMYLSDAYTIPASLAGIPGLSIPCGFAQGLPVGLQVLGNYLDEATILDVGEVYEQATDWCKRKPEMKG